MYSIYIVRYDYMALGKTTSVLREAMLLCAEPRRVGVSNGKSAPRRVCGHILKPCKTNKLFFRLSTRNSL